MTSWLQFRRLALLATFLLPAVAAPGQSPSAPSRPPLAIGFLREGSDLGNAETVMERLRRFLAARPALIGAMAEAGFAPDFELSPCDGPRDMEQRMNASEFDLVFATGVVYVRQYGDYAEPVLMTSLPGDIKQANQVGVLRRGVLIAGLGSPLFHNPNATDDQKREALASNPLAVASSDSAAGYIYPRLFLRTKFGLSRPGEYWFCGTDAEVVKHVVSGLAPLGACREGELQALLPGAPEGKYFSVLFRTDPFPTDPILLRADLAPDRSPLGSEMKLAIRDFFKLPGEGPAGLSVENASGRSYELLEFALRQIGERAAAPPAPARQAEPSTGTITIVPVMPAAPPRTRPAMPPGLGDRP